MKVIKLRNHKVLNSYKFCHTNQHVHVFEQATYYYPHGMPMAESTNPTANRYKYTGKELLADHGVNILDYGPRPYDPTTGIWWSVDEHSADYSPLSHYSMCGGDPINFVDQNGKDVFRFNQQGYLLERISDETQDLIQMQIGSGDDARIIDGPKFEYGIVENCRTISGLSGKFENATILQIRGDANGQNTFEFFAQNGEVEFSHFETGEKGETGLNFITTSHQNDKDYGSAVLIRDQLQFGYSVRSMTHNHPSGWLNPSQTDLTTRDELLKTITFKNTEFYLYVKKEIGKSFRRVYNYTKQKKHNDAYPEIRNL